MIVKLIPVLEIHSKGHIPAPEQWGYWNYPALWDTYNAACHQTAGFSDDLVPYLPGSSFYKLSEITANNIVKIVRDHVHDFVNVVYQRSDTCPLPGGYVLNIDGKDAYFPQCCADLGGISYWERIAFNDRPFYDEGHPTPVLTFTDNEIVFDFDVDEFGERFVPPLLIDKIKVNKADLKAAVANAKAELYNFADKVKRINVSENVNIPDIDKMLIWGYG